MASDIQIDVPGLKLTLAQKSKDADYLLTLTNFINRFTSEKEPKSFTIHAAQSMSVDGQYTVYISPEVQQELYLATCKILRAAQQKYTEELLSIEPEVRKHFQCQ